MTIQTPAPQARTPPRTPLVPAARPGARYDLSQLGASDREFLPGALEILATPPAPVSGLMIATICGAVVAALAWSYFGFIDITAVAYGKVQPSGHSKIVQPLEPGRVVAIDVQNGARVNAGDVLLELDPTETGADQAATASDLEAAQAGVARYRTALAIAGGAGANADLKPRPIPFPSSVPADVREREAHILEADLAQLRTAVASLEAQFAEKDATYKRLEASIAARAKLIDLARERVEIRTHAETLGAGSRALIIESQQQLEQYVTTDVGERGQLAETLASEDSLRRKLDETLSKFVAEQSQKLGELDQKRAHLEQDLVKASSKRARTRLTAPIAGVVQQLNVFAMGQVVSAGQSVLTIVPLDAALEVEAMIVNKDIGFIEPGQRAVIKVDAFPFTRYGTIDASVTRVSHDAVDERSYMASTDASQSGHANGAAATGATGGSGSSFVFPATLELDRKSIKVDSKELPLMAGMTVQVEIKTGERRLIDYILSPVTEVMQASGHER